MQAAIESPPSKFSITVTSKCNLRCPTCQYILSGSSFFNDRFELDFDKYIWTLDRFEESLKRLTLTGGEPLLHPEIDGMVDAALERGISVGMPTNGILIQRKFDLIRKISGHFQISLDAWDQESYERFRGGTAQQWQAILDGLELLGNEGVQYNVSFLISKDNIGRMKEMLEFASRFTPEMVNFHSIHQESGTSDLVLKTADSEVASTMQELKSRNDYAFSISLPVLFDDASAHFANRPCTYPFHGLYFNGAGDVSYCCQLQHDKSIGNVFDGYDFNSKKMVSWRKMHIAGKYPPECLYCHRRFFGEAELFDHASKEWKSAAG